MSAPEDVTEALARFDLYNIARTDVPYTFMGPDGYGYNEQLVNYAQDLVTFGEWLVDLQPTLVTSSDGTVANIIALTQAAFDAIAVKDPATLYVIVI